MMTMKCKMYTQRLHLYTESEDDEFIEEEV
jgi:hypothetical protein